MICVHIRHNFARNQENRLMQKIKLLLAFFILASTSLFAQDEIEVVNIENPAVQAYMADSTYYKNSDFRVSVISKYYNKELYGPDLDRPQGKKVKWTPTTGAENISEVRITVSESKDYSSPFIHNPSSKSADSYEIKNCIPGRVYYYKVEEFLKDGSVTEVANGVFRTVGQVRMIQVLNAHNVRDIGGWMTLYGVPVKYGRLYRSGSLDAIKPAGRQDFAVNLNVGAELDLRSESRLKKSKLGDDKDLLVLAHSDYMSGVKRKNHLYVKDLAWIVERLREGKNVDWHCAIGCDRCGTLSFLIEGLLGLNEIDLGRDYELSTLSKFKRLRRSVKEMINYIKTFGGEGDNLAQCFYNYWLSIGASREDMDYLLEVMLDYPEKR